MLFGVLKPDCFTRPILDLFEKTIFNYSVNNLIDPKLCTVEYAQTKQVIETVHALGKNAWVWAKDLKDGWHDVSVNEKDIHNLGFMLVVPDRSISDWDSSPSEMSQSECMR